MSIPTDCPFAATDIVVATLLFGVDGGTPDSTTIRASVQSVMDMCNSPAYEDAQVLHLDAVTANYTLVLA